MSTNSKPSIKAPSANIRDLDVSNLRVVPRGGGRFDQYS